MNLEFHEEAGTDRLYLRLTRSEGEQIYASILETLVQASEEHPLKFWAMEGVCGATQLASEDLAWRIANYEHIPGPPSLVKTADAMGVDMEEIDGVIVEASKDIETIAKIEGMEAYSKAYGKTLKQGI
jgi:hypothetical protein